MASMVFIACESPSLRGRSIVPASSGGWADPSVHVPSRGSAAHHERSLELDTAAGAGHGVSLHSCSQGGHERAAVPVADRCSLARPGSTGPSPRDTARQRCGQLGSWASIVGCGSSGSLRSDRTRPLPTADPVPPRCPRCSSPSSVSFVEGTWRSPHNRAWPGAGQSRNEASVAHARRLSLAQRRKAVGLSQDGLGRRSRRRAVDRGPLGAGRTEPQAWVRPKLARRSTVTMSTRRPAPDRPGGPDSVDRTRLRRPRDRLALAPLAGPRFGSQIGADTDSPAPHRTARLRRLDDHLGGMDTYEVYTARWMRRRS